MNSQLTPLKTFLYRKWSSFEGDAQCRIASISVETYREGIGAHAAVIVEPEEDSPVYTTHAPANYPGIALLPSKALNWDTKNKNNVFFRAHKLISRYLLPDRHIVRFNRPSSHELAEAVKTNLRKERSP